LLSLFLVLRAAEKQRKEVVVAVCTDLRKEELLTQIRDLLKK
jgi:large-conductance mechanosensitive channel